MEGAQNVTNRELAILGYCIEALLELNATDKVKEVAKMMKGLAVAESDKDKE